MTVPPPPPHPSDLPYGTVLQAGLGTSEVVADIDFETYSEAGFVWHEPSRKWQSLPDASQGKKGLPVVGAAVYSEHPTCDVLVFRYNLKDGRGSQHWRPGLPPPVALFNHIALGGLVEAWNVGFEQWIWENVCTPRYGWPVVPEVTWRCAMAKARAHCLPGGLDAAGNVLALQVKKDKAGKALLDRFSMPRNPTKADPRERAPTLWTHEDCAREVALILPFATTKAAQRDAHLIIADDYERTQALDKYCAIDIQTEAEASAAIPDLSPFELRTWQDDRRINRRGVRIDMAGVHDCIAVIKQAQHRYGGELRALAGCAPSEVAQLTRWLADQGLYLQSLDDEAITEALTRPLEPHVRRALEIRATVASASVKKVFAMRNQATRHSRLHDLYTYHGARTGRPTGNGPQPTNLPKAGPMNHRCGYDYADRPLPSGGCGKYHGAHTMWCQWCGRFTMRGPKDAREWSPEAAEDALVSLTHRSLDWMEVLWGDALLAVAGVLRGLFIASPGTDFVSSDFTAIEGVVVAAMAGEQWRVDAYEQSRPMYLLSAERMFGVSVEEMEAFARQTGKHHHLRQKGKCGELACFAADTLVLTDQGYVRIAEVTTGDRVWDGTEWVRHKGVVPRGLREVIDLAGVAVTPEHKIFCGDSWVEARQLASSESTFRRALAIGSANLSAPAIPNPAEGSFCARLFARVGRCLTSWRITAYGLALPLGATLAHSRNLRAPAAPGLGTTWLSPSAATGSVCSVEFPPRSADATTQKTQGTPRMGGGGSRCLNLFGTRESCFSRTWRAFRAGITRVLSWIGSTWTKGTNLKTFGSSRPTLTGVTSAPSGSCSGGCSPLRNVFDIAHAGPRNRFTVLTDRGPVIAHNCGFGGWISSMRQFGVDGTDEELKDTVLKWRAASPNIEWYWGGQRKGIADMIRKVPGADRWDRTEYYFGLEGAAVLAVINPGEWRAVLRMDGMPTGVRYLCHNDTLYCQVPSGGLITYHRPRLEQSEESWRGLSLSFEGWNTNPKNGPLGWVRMNTYSGRLAENVTQKVARDKQMCAINRAEASQRYPVVLHTYDEIVSEADEGDGSVEELEALMVQSEVWCEGWPIKAAGGWRGKRYRKG